MRIEESNEGDSKQGVTKQGSVRLFRSKSVCQSIFCNYNSFISKTPEEEVRESHRDATPSLRERRERPPSFFKYIVSDRPLSEQFLRRSTPGNGKVWEGRSGGDFWYPIYISTLYIHPFVLVLYLQSIHINTYHKYIFTNIP